MSPRKKQPTPMKAARKKLGLTQEDAAEKLGISTNYFAVLERKESLPSLAMAKKISKVLKVPIETVLDIS